jgi:ubiquinone/menaquinone biosynthesis C-methylase UbiE
MTARLSNSEIYEFWNRQAAEHHQSSAASWSDFRVIEMEVEQIRKHLNDGDHVLDVGCANGFSTVQFAAHRNIKLRGLDYIPRMIEEAQERVKLLDSNLRSRLEFAVGDITRLTEEEDSSYDKVVVIRVLINLGNWETQRQGLQECVRVLRPGGTLLISEAILQGWERLNRLRSEWGLAAIPIPPFNEYLDQEKVVAELSSSMKLVEISDFASTYYVGTRVLKPLLCQAVSAPLDMADPGAEWNRWFSALPAAGDYGTQKLLVFEKL